MTAFTPGLLLALSVAAGGGGPSIPLACEPSEPVSLQAVWTEVRDSEPGYGAASERIAAQSAALSAIRREWAPGASLDGVENWGQRLSPGEERVLGVGFRGDLRMAAQWTVLDTGRRARLREGSFLRGEAEVASAAFDVAFRAELSRLYVEAAFTEALVDAARERQEFLAALSGPVRRRLEAGVDPDWEAYLLDETLARAERLLTEAEQARDGGRAALSAVLGRCARATAVSPTAGVVSIAADPTAQPSLASASHPEVRRLERLADAHGASADVERAGEGFRLGLVGTAGPTRSRVFTDESFRLEYLVGVGASWTPDLAGIRGRRAAAEAARSRAFQAEAESHRTALAREVGRARAELARSAERGRRVAEEVERTEQVLEAALLRWREGVGHWTDVMDAHSGLYEAKRARIESDHQDALALIALAEAEAELDDLPRRLGQDGGE